MEMSCREMLVARHGETQWNLERKWQGSSDIPLNETGILQAKKLGKSLINEGISRIYSSDMARAMATARIVSDIVESGDITTDNRLRERNLGKFEGWKSYEVADFMGIPRESADILETDELTIEGWPEVEPWKTFVERVWSAILDISQSSQADKTLVVAHGGVMRAITYTLTEEGLGMPEFSNGQIIRLRLDGKNWEIA